MPGANTRAYLSWASVTNRKRFIMLVVPGDVLELFERVVEGRRASKLLHLVRGVVQHRVVCPAPNVFIVLVIEVELRITSAIEQRLFDTDAGVGLLNI
jgi:hypothetical protein